MAAEETVEDEVIELEEQEVAEQPPLDLDALVTEAEKRVERMKERKPGKKTELTFSGWILALNEATDAALSKAIRVEAETRKAFIDSHSASEKYKNKMLAPKVVAGEYDA